MQILPYRLLLLEYAENKKIVKAFIICYNFLKGITAAIYHKNFEGNITQTKGTYMEKNLTGNYEKQIYIGRDLFLKYNQDMLIKKYKLKMTTHTCT